MSLRSGVLALTLVGMTVAPAWADATAFVGANTTPENRQARGFALGIELLVVGFEFEYGNTTEDETHLAPSLKTGMGNVFVQMPFAILGIVPYATAGAGMYRESLGAESDTGFGLNTGGGIKVNMVGPIRLRVDYRVFKLGNGALYSPAHRVYVGVNLRF